MISTDLATSHSKPTCYARQEPCFKTENFPMQMKCHNSKIKGMLLQMHTIKMKIIKIQILSCKIGGTQPSRRALKRVPIPPRAIDGSRWLFDTFNVLRWMIYRKKNRSIELFVSRHVSTYQGDARGTSIIRLTTLGASQRTAVASLCKINLFFGLFHTCVTSRYSSVRYASTNPHLTD